MRVARALLAAEPDLNRVLCVTADRFPPGAYYEQAYNLISDGAAACVVSRSPGGYRLLAAHQITNGAMVPRRRRRDRRGLLHLHPPPGQRVARQGGPDRGGPGLGGPAEHQRQGLADPLPAARIDSARVFQDSLPDVGHMISGDNLVNLAYLAARRTVRPGEKLLLVMAGYGMNWQGLLLEKA